jgi:ADP-ribose pyrophosphatase
MEWFRAGTTSFASVRKASVSTDEFLGKSALTKLQSVNSTKTTGNESMNNDITRYAGRYLSLMERDGWEFASRSNASGVVVLVPVTNEREIVLVEQFRIPVGKNVIELPAGLVGDHDDPDESILKAARRELKEETGFEATHQELLMECPNSAGMSDEIVSFVLARGLRRVGPGGGDDSEDILVHIIPLEEVDHWLREQQAVGKPMAPKIYAALYCL